MVCLRFRGLSALLLVAVVVTIGWQAVDTIACDTPVYRYAMYRWEPAPYEVYYFHEEAVPKEAAALHKKIEEASRNEERTANVMLIPVPLKDDPELKRVPPDVRKTWTEQESPTVPTYMIVSPHGIKLFQGDLDEPTFEKLTDSPVRQEIAKQLEQGKAGVMVMLTGSDEKANDEAEKIVTGLQKDIAAGKVELYLPPPAFGPPGDEQPKPPTIEMGFCRLKRDATAEHWLAEFLLSMESDLKDEEFADKPMVFCVFGRGRALPPFIGKGINQDNLLNCVDFITGACSCTVKDQNPGMDLLFAKDWWTIAENLANEFGAEEGNDPQYGAADLFPDLIIPSGEAGPSAEEMAVEADAAEGTAENESSGDEGVAESATDPEDPTATQPAEAAPQQPESMVADAGQAAPTEAISKDAGTGQAEPPVESGSGEPDSAEREVAAGEGPGEESETAAGPVIAARTTGSAEELAGEDPQDTVARTDTFTSVFAVGAGLAVALVLLFGLTFFVLRPK